jgi:osmotically inducible protein OsmC
VPRIERNATVTWDGDVARGRGRIDAGTGAFTGLEYSLPIRVGTGNEGKTSPEELLAAAHAGCLAMGLAAELEDPDAQIRVSAKVVMDEVEGKGHLIVESQLRVRARVSGLDEDALAEAVRKADVGCPFSQLIKASAKVSVQSELEGM